MRGGCLFTRTILSLALVSGCTGGGDAQGDLDTGAGKADQISGRDDPSGLLSSAERRLSMLIGADDVGQTFGVPDDRIPYPDTYWPMVDNGVAVQWLEKSGATCQDANDCADPQPSPLAKYMSITDPDHTQDAIDWEVKHHGKDVPGVQDWFGHCPGWTGSAQMHAPVTEPVLLASDGRGGVEKCAEGDPGCVKFEIGDINGLEAEAWNNARSRFIGARCDTEPAKVERDEFGRIERTGKGCQGLNAGALLIVAANQMKIHQQAFNIDAQNQFNTDQIWNQPAYRYTVHDFATLSESQAANLVASGGASDKGDHGDYLWNGSAKGFALVDFEIHWVAETGGPNLEQVSGLRTTRTTRMKAVIELDRPADDPEARIIGGEYLDDPSVGANRLAVHPFVWLAFDVGPDDGSGHNPFVKGELVKQIVSLALGDQGQTQCGHDLCQTGDALEAGCSSCAADVCGGDAFCCTQTWDQSCVDEAAKSCGLTCGG